MNFTNINYCLTNVFHRYFKQKKKVSLHSSQIIQEQDEFPVGH